MFLTLLLIALSGVSLTAALVLWPRIREFCENSLFPWLEANLPQLALHVRDAFAEIDGAVTAVRRTVTQAWERLRKHLLHQVVLLERKSSSHWVCRITSFLVKVLADGQPHPVRVVTEADCAWDELPANIRSEWLRQGHGHHEINATELRDAELATAAC